MCYYGSPRQQLFEIFIYPCHIATALAPNNYNMINATQDNAEQLTQCALLTQLPNKHNNKTNNAQCVEWKVEIPSGC